MEVAEEEFDTLFKKFKHSADLKKTIIDEDIVDLIASDSAVVEKNTLNVEKRVIWMDGQFIPWNNAQVPVLTHGLHYASAVFEGERACNGNVFKLTEHNERLHFSAFLWLRTGLFIHQLRIVY